MTCKTCRFWSNDPSFPVGECRRYPPKLTVCPVGDGYCDITTKFPDAPPQDWCGEWQAIPLDVSKVPRGLPLCYPIDEGEQP